MPLADFQDSAIQTICNVELCAADTKSRDDNKANDASQKRCICVIVFFVAISVSSLSPLDNAQSSAFDPVQDVAACKRRDIKIYPDDPQGNVTTESGIYY